MLRWQYPLLAGIALLHDKSCLPALGLVDRSLVRSLMILRRPRCGLAFFPQQRRPLCFFDEAAKISPDYQFSTRDPVLIPSVESLDAAYQQHCAFASATSGGDRLKGGTEPIAATVVNPLEDG